ncbi:elongation factor G [Ruminococcaceae bacterium OttesenSCG-928-A16]|nr:elongation factor G [Ruminococcaceae bacterium OttesenSCG-928-A16]
MSHTPDKIRNIMIAGHNSSGKTSLAEALLFAAKATDRLGRTEEGNTTMDFDPEEIRRHVSLASAVAPLEYDGVKMNLVDVPGLFDFELGKYEGIMAVESVLIAVSARSGVTVGAQKAYSLAEKYGKARMVYIGKLDADHADFYKVFEQLKAEFGPSVCPVVVPHMDGKSVIYVNLVENKAYSYMAGTPTEVPVPDMGHRLEGLKAAMYEAVAETDEALMEKFFEGEEFTQDELTEGIRLGVKTGAITPVLCGVSTTLEATDMMLRYMKKLLPSAQRGAMVEGITDNGTELVECDPAGPLVAYVFKTVADPFVGKLSYVKVVRGVLKSDTPAVNSRTGEAEKLGKLLFMKGKKQLDAAEITAGDVGAVTKLSNTKTGDALCAPGKVVKIEGPAFPHATYSMALRPKQKGDESKISGALQRLTEEDITLEYRVDPETLQQVISGLGEQHLEAVIAKMKAKFGVEVELSEPRIPYRETLRKKVKAQGRHKKQTGGHGQFGDVIIEFEPTEGDEMVFEEKVFGGSVPKNFFPAVEKGLREAVGRGVVAGYPVVGLKATLLDGSYHPVDSSEMAFKMAAKLAYRAALPDASPVLLEPIGALKANVPENNTGDLMGEVNKRRGRVVGMNPTDEGLQCVEAEVPLSEMHDFTTYMRQLTQGRGTYDFAFVRYEPLPAHLEDKVVAEAKKIFVDKGDEE